MENWVEAPPWRKRISYSSGTFISLRSLALVSSKILTNTLDRWLISMTDIPEPW